MKLPKFFMVFGQKIKIRVGSLDPRVAAQFEPSSNLITLNDLNVSEAEVLHSLLHEIGHAMFYRVSINQAVSFEVHEFIVNNYATMLLENFDLKVKK